MSKKFAERFADILGTGKVTTADTIEAPATIAMPVVQKAAVAAATPVVGKAKKAKKDEAESSKRWAEVEGKVNVTEGSPPFVSTVYPRGYVQLRFTKPYSKAAVTLDEVRAMRDFFSNEEAYGEWEAAAIAAGLK